MEHYTFPKGEPSKRIEADVWDWATVRPLRSETLRPDKGQAGHNQ